jgi:hypothetical protein
MKKQLMILGLVLSSPLVLAQTGSGSGSGSGSSSDQNSQSQPATPALPALPTDSAATPATPSSNSSGTEVDKPKSRKNGQTSTGARSGDNSVGATGNPNNQSGKARTRSNSGQGDFASMDGNSDGSLSRDELAGKTGLNFDQLDTDKNGNLSQSEFQVSAKASPQDGVSATTGSNSKGQKKGTQDEQSTKDQLQDERDKASDKVR